MGEREKMRNTEIAWGQRQAVALVYKQEFEQSQQKNNRCDKHKLMTNKVAPPSLRVNVKTKGFLAQTVVFKENVNKHQNNICIRVITVN